MLPRFYPAAWLSSMGAGGWYARARQDSFCSSPPEALKPTKPAIQISDADRKRKILITDKSLSQRHQWHASAAAVKKWREKGDSLRVDRYRCIEGRCLHQIMSAKNKVTKTKTALKQETFERTI